MRALSKLRFSDKSLGSKTPLSLLELTNFPFPHSIFPVSETYSVLQSFPPVQKEVMTIALKAPHGSIRFEKQEEPYMMKQGNKEERRE